MLHVHVFQRSTYNSIHVNLLLIHTAKIILTEPPQNKLTLGNTTGLKFLSQGKGGAVHNDVVCVRF